MDRRNGLGALFAAIAAALSGCGGRGGGTEEPPPPPPPSSTYNVDAAYRNLSAAARTFTLTGTASNSTPLTLTWTITPAGDATFPLTNTVAKRVDSSVQIRTAASTVLVDGGQQAYFDATMNGLGALRSDGSCSSATNTTLPTAANPGDRGSLGSSVIYATCSTTAPVIGRITGEWSLEQVGSTMFLCARSTLEDAAGTALSQEVDCVEIDTAGAVGARARIDVTVSGTVVRFAN